jgi:hypothetical protein
MNEQLTLAVEYQHVHATMRQAVLTHFPTSDRVDRSAFIVDHVN